MIDYSSLYAKLEKGLFTDWKDALPTAVDVAWQPSRHGHHSEWLNVLQELPITKPSIIELDRHIQIGDIGDLQEDVKSKFNRTLHKLHPWRKGPFKLFGVEIDAEWRSDWKWARIKDQISPLEGRVVLDVGCGNGYYMLRMMGQGAKFVIGVEPMRLYVIQFYAIKNFLGDIPAHVLPLGLEDVPRINEAFDTVFSMGVLYHRREPLKHLARLSECLRQGGELVLETLVVDGGEGKAMTPDKRYAKMRNVWNIPSCKTAVTWLQKSGYENIRIIDVTKTTTEEQRSTQWMTFESLIHFLDPTNPALTIEGYPAPKRAILLANKA